MPLPPLASLVCVYVVLRNNTSTSPALSTSKRSAAVSGRNSTLVASPRTAAATARQKSASKPSWLPSGWVSEKPTSEPLTPQRSTPRACTAASVPGPCPTRVGVAGAPVVVTAGSGGAGVVTVDSSPPPQAAATRASADTSTANRFHIYRSPSPGNTFLRTPLPNGRRCGAWSLIKILPASFWKEVGARAERNIARRPGRARRPDAPWPGRARRTSPSATGPAEPLPPPRGA